MPDLRLEGAASRAMLVYCTKGALLGCWLWQQNCAFVTITDASPPLSKQNKSDGEKFGDSRLLLAQL